MKIETAEKVIKKMSWEITKQERFLGLVARANQMKPKDRENVLKGACWIDGTIETQIKFAMDKRARLVKARSTLSKRYGIAIF